MQPGGGSEGRSGLADPYSHDQRERILRGGLGAPSRMIRDWRLRRAATAGADGGYGRGTVKSGRPAAEGAAVCRVLLSRNAQAAARFLILRPTIAVLAPTGVQHALSAEPLRGQGQGGEPNQRGRFSAETHHGNYLYVAQEGKFSRYNQK